MYCPRLEHFVRLNPNGTIGRCGHMVSPLTFQSYKDLEQSDWLKKIKEQMNADQWPDECKRCQYTEKQNGTSVRLNSIERHKKFKPKKDDYLIVGGVLDNVCNSACQTCNSSLSTKIGSLKSSNYPRIDNYVRFWELPLDRIMEVDVNGGEPTASRNYKKILANLPKHTKVVRMNTNCSRTIKELEDILQKGIAVIVTMSLDGVDKVHDYVRWPIKWKDYKETVEHYLQLREKYKLLKLDFWTTVSCLNVADLENIQQYAKSKNIPHSWAYLEQPDVYNVKYKNKFTEPTKHLQPNRIAIENDNSDGLIEYIKKQDALRKIDHKDYFSLVPK